MSLSRTRDGSESGLTERERWLLARVCSLKMWRKGEVTAPHKPLLMLVALMRCEPGQPRMVPFVEWEAALVPLLKAILKGKAVVEPRYPFWRLQRDSVWEVKADAPMKQRRGNTDPLRSEFVKKNARGGLPAEIFDMLVGNSAFKARIMRLIFERYFSDGEQETLKRMLRLAC